MKCECSNLVYREVVGDYDGVLYTSCKDCGLIKNVHTGVIFNKTKKRGKYDKLYQYKNDKLVGYSIYKAEGLSYNDDINKGENLLWGTRGINGDKELTFKPIKNLSKNHIKAILEEGHTNDKEYILAFKKQIGNDI